MSPYNSNNNESNKGNNDDNNDNNNDNNNYNNKDNISCLTCVALSVFKLFFLKGPAVFKLFKINICLLFAIVLCCKEGMRVFRFCFL